MPETKFTGTEGERLSKLDATSEEVASKIINMNDNKSPGVDGMTPTFLKETVPHLSM